jgi:hypothetical protein
MHGTAQPPTLGVLLPQKERRCAIQNAKEVAVASLRYVTSQP